MTGGAGPDFDGTVTTDSGNNLISNSSGSSGFSAGSGDLLDVDPLLSSLGSYGGTTETMTLLPGSPAIDAGSNGLAYLNGNPLSTDQRGVNRTINGVTDIGAVESHPFTITILFGNSQQATVNTNFCDAARSLGDKRLLRARDGWRGNVHGAGGGASATFPGGNKAVTNLIGLASVNAKANTVAGGYSIVASSRGASSVSFSMTNAAAAATQLAIQTQPSAAAAAGVAFSTQPVVYVEDQFGNLETGDNAPRSRPRHCRWVWPAQGTTHVTVSGGVATFTNLSDSGGDNHASIHQLSGAAVGDFEQHRGQPGRHHQLAIQTQPSATATAGVTFSTQPVIYVEDQYGNLETGDNTTQVTAALDSGTGPLMGTTTVTVSGGHRHVHRPVGQHGRDDHAPVHQLSGPDRSNIEQHRDQSGGGEPVGDQTEPSATATAGVAFSTQPVIYVEDQFGNLETGDNSTQVTAASLPGGSGPLRGRRP